MNYQHLSRTMLRLHKQYMGIQRRLLTALVLLLTLVSLPRTAYAQMVTTLAGNTNGFADGTGAAARFDNPYGVCSDGAGNLFVADFNNHRIRRIIMSTGVVTTLAGSTQGFTDGTSMTAQFAFPSGVCSDGAGNLFVADQVNHRIRRIVIATGVVTTLAGSTQGVANGTGAAAQFNFPTGVCSDGAGNLFVADAENHRIRRIVIATGVVTTLAGSTLGFAEGTGAAAQFDNPVGICNGGAGNLFVADYNNHRIRQIVIATGVVTTLAGNTQGFAEGIGAAARFNRPYGVCSDGAGNLFVADYGNHRIRQIAPLSIVVIPPPPPPPAAPSLSGGTFSASIGIPFGTTLSLGGNPAPSVSLTGGALPPGISLAGNSLSGIPSALGSYTFTITATNSEGTTTANATITVGPAVPQITGFSPPNGVFGTTVIITGFNLGGATAVSVGGVPVQSFTASGNSIIAVLGAPGNGGTVNVSTPFGNSVIGGFSFEPPPVPVLGLTFGSVGGGSPRLLIPNIPTGDSNAGFFLPGQNIPNYASISITPISSTGATIGFPTSLQIVGVSSTGASLLIPAYALLPGTQLLTVRIGDVTVSTTFAIVRAPAPTITGLSVSSTTANGVGFTTIVTGTGFFRNGLARVFVNEEESYFSQILSTSQAQVYIPAAMNVRHGIARIRIQNYDGQSTGANVVIIGRNAPLILSVTPKRTNGNLSFIVRGGGFDPRLTAILGRQNAQVVNVSITEFELLVPSDFNLGGSATVLLFITNPDGQRYGFLISGEAFQAPGTTVIGNSTKGVESSTEAAFSEVSDETSVETTSPLRAYPNPATETVSVEMPQSLKARRYSVVNALGEEVLHGTVQGDEALTLDVRRLVKGLYTVRVVGASRVRAAQVIVR